MSVRLSKTLSYVLRHRPDTIGITLADGGWVDVEVLLDALAAHRKATDRATLGRVVAENDKQRFEFSDDGQRIRARQGHSVPVDLAYEPVEPPAILYHGTATRSVDAILSQGLKPMSRQHVHLSEDRATMLAVGARHGKPVLLRVDAAALHAAGQVFHVTGNNVWLTNRVPADALTVADDAE